jgi:DNA ligase D-like protein (predicted 3'-phosphoesterase)
MSPTLKNKKINEENKLSNLPLFVIQEHHATTLHWDFRLEIEGVLKSWAITKIPPENTGVKRLAIEVPDHSINYASFEGEIKEGYGKGTVKIWDKGKYKLTERTKNKIEFELYGGKLKGKYVLIYTGYGKNKNGWLFFKIS